MTPSPSFSGDEDALGAAVSEAATSREIAADIGAEVPPQQLIFSLFGLYSRTQDGWLSSAAIVRLGRELGIEEPLTRSAVSRMKRRGFVRSSKRAGRAGYELTPSSVRIILDGDKHVFGRGRALPEDSWVVVGFSVPEHQRERRHRIRTALIRLGFGTVSPGMWIAPAHLERETQAALHSLGVTDYVDIFRAQFVAVGDPREKVASWWDLDALTGMYATFIDRFTPADERHQPNDVDPAAAFRDYVPMLATWRRLPYLDPGLPLALLPSPWAGSIAEDLFSRLDQKLRGPAETYALSML
ncbi:PaaX family transcriptional regulator C-terminal domain-containing protein [Sphaerisporangium sp. NPDC051011]|uniref:PaaX family transcriptional regulator n=1 Tax=Sphaerisporangium sp. NPDC051011 TaxID=3155792 RepID=UPI0033E8A79C